MTMHTAVLDPSNKQRQWRRAGGMFHCSKWVEWTQRWVQSKRCALGCLWVTRDRMRKLPLPNMPDSRHRTCEGPSCGRPSIKGHDSIHKRPTTQSITVLARSSSTAQIFDMTLGRFDIVWNWKVRERERTLYYCRCFPEREEVLHIAVRASYDASKAIYALYRVLALCTQSQQQSSRE